MYTAHVHPSILVLCAIVLDFSNISVLAFKNDWSCGALPPLLCSLGPLPYLSATTEERDSLKDTKVIFFVFLILQAWFPFQFIPVESP